MKFSAEMMKMSERWAPFRTASKGDLVRPLTAIGGVEDRLRVVAFAELQARDLFRWGAERFRGDIPSEWYDCWVRFADVENRHAQMLLDRMAELGFAPETRVVSDKLSKLCLAASDAPLFLFLLASAEERGMESGFILGQQMQAVDACSATIFQTIAQEELEHVNFSKTVFAVEDLGRFKVLSKELHMRLQEAGTI